MARKPSVILTVRLYGDENKRRVELASRNDHTANSWCYRIVQERLEAEEVVKVRRLREVLEDSGINQEDIEKVIERTKSPDD